MGERTVLHIGFTGTQFGMTDAQKRVFMDVFGKAFTADDLVKHNTVAFHHGDCVGADAQAHKILLYYGFFGQIIVHPPTDSKKRAFCLEGGVKVLGELPYIERNHAIVDACSILIAVPHSAIEMVRSGTWATVRYARQKGKRVIIIYPDGTVEEIRGE